MVKTETVTDKDFGLIERLVVEDLRKTLHDLYDNHEDMRLLILSAIGLFLDDVAKEDGLVVLGPAAMANIQESGALNG